MPPGPETFLDQKQLFLYREEYLLFPKNMGYFYLDQNMKYNFTSKEEEILK